MTMHISLHISCLILIVGYCKYILLLNKPCWNVLLLAVWTVAMCEPSYVYNQTNAIMTNGMLMKHHHPTEFENFFHLNLSDSKLVESPWEQHVSTDLALVCVIIMYIIISKWMGSLQNAISLPRSLLFLSVWNCKQRYKTQYSFVSGRWKSYFKSSK
jgi:hypothetical protein